MSSVNPPKNDDLKLLMESNKQKELDLKERALQGMEKVTENRTTRHANAENASALRAKSADAADGVAYKEYGTYSRGIVPTIVV